LGDDIRAIYYSFMVKPEYGFPEAAFYLVGTVRVRAKELEKLSAEAKS